MGYSRPETKSNWTTARSRKALSLGVMALQDINDRVSLASIQNGSFRFCLLKPPCEYS